MTGPEHVSKWVYARFQKEVGARIEAGFEQVVRAGVEAIRRDVLSGGALEKAKALTQEAAGSVIDKARDLVAKAGRRLF